MPRSIILTNHKGGVGKSTSAANIAIGIVTMLKHFGAPNSWVLLIDTDSQAHASLITTGRHDFGVEDSLYTVLMADRKNAPQVMSKCIVGSTWDPDLHVLLGSILLEGGGARADGRRRSAARHRTTPRLLDWKT